MTNEIELYLHIPFCVRKCGYCDFLSAPADEKKQAEYARALANEIRQIGRLYASREVTSVFIGGGTPSLLTPDLMREIADALAETFDLSGLKGKPKSVFRKKEIPPKIEFTVECNPGTLTKDKLKTYKKIGVNRLSIGLQSADENELKELGRIHTVSDFLESFELAREAGFSNINVDLMQAIPRQTLSSWKKTLIATAALRPEHISAYSLIVEDGTPFGERKREGGELLLPNEDEERKIYYSTREILEEFGYRRYEISNYALPGMECRHNCGYWKRRSYLGLGLGASSMIDNVRWKNTSDLDEYIGILGSDMPGTDVPEPNVPGTDMPELNVPGLNVPGPNVPGPNVPGLNVPGPNEPGLNVPELNVPGLNVPRSDMPGTDMPGTDVPEPWDFMRKLETEREELSYKDQMAEFMFLGLRMTEGVSKEEFFETFKADYDYIYGSVTQELLGQGFIHEERKDADTRVMLTDRGVDFSNRVLANFLP